MKSQIDPSECEPVLGSKAKHKIIEPAGAFRFVSSARQRNNVPSEDSNENENRLSLSDRFKALTYNSIPSDSITDQIVNNEKAVVKRPVSRAKRTGGSKIPNTNSLPETVRPTSVEEIPENPVAKTTTKKVPACPKLFEPCPKHSMFEDISSEDDVQTVDEIVANVARKSQINNTRNGK